MNIISVILYFIAAFITFNDEYYTLLNWFNSFDKAQDFLFWSMIIFLYYSILEILFARTFAKYITNTMVVMIDGSKPKPICILGRSLIRIFPIEYFSFLRGRKLGMHDEYSGTFVVKKNKFEESLKDYNEYKNK